jgi:hypothetical protein
MSPYCSCSTGVAEGCQESTAVLHLSQLPGAGCIACTNPALQLHVSCSTVLHRCCCCCIWRKVHVYSTAAAAAPFEGCMPSRVKPPSHSAGTAWYLLHITTCSSHSPPVVLLLPHHSVCSCASPCCIWLVKSLPQHLMPDSHSQSQHGEQPTWYAAVATPKRVFLLHMANDKTAALQLVRNP